MIVTLIAAVAGGFVGAVPLEARPVTMRDYPDSAYNRGLEGAQRFAVTVDPTGRPIACAVTMSTGAEALKSTPCRVAMRRARFTPARDATGAPITGVWTADAAFYQPDHRGPAPRIFYDVAIRVESLSADQPTPLAEIEQLVDAAGSVQDCRVVKGSGADQLDQLACSKVGPPFAPVLAAGGAPTPAVVRQTVAFVPPSAIR